MDPLLFLILGGWIVVWALWWNRRLIKQRNIIKGEAFVMVFFLMNAFCTFDNIFLGGSEYWWLTALNLTAMLLLLPYFWKWVRPRKVEINFSEKDL